MGKKEQNIWFLCNSETKFNHVHVCIRERERDREMEREGEINRLDQKEKGNCCRRNRITQSREHIGKRSL